MLIGIGESWSINRSYFQMIEGLFLRGKACFDTSKAVLSWELTEEHGDEMILGTETASMIFGFSLVDGF